MTRTPRAPDHLHGADGVGDPDPIVGRTPREAIALPDLDRPPMPAIAPPGVILNGVPAPRFGDIGTSRGYPDARSFRRKFGLVIPATNTSMEYELWGIIFRNDHADGDRKWRKGATSEGWDSRIRHREKAAWVMTLLRAQAHEQ